MPRTVEHARIPSAEDENYSDYHYGLAYSALPGEPYPDAAEPTPNQNILSDPTHFVDEVTGSHDFTEIVAKFEENDELLKSDPHLRLVIWEQVVDQLPPLEPQDLAKSTDIILQSLEDVRNDPHAANMITLMAVAQTARYLDGKNQQVVLQTLDNILHKAQNAGSETGIKIEPNLAHAAEEVIEAAKDGRIDTGEIDAELLRKADLKAAEALDKAIRRKQRRELFKKVITGKIFKRETATVSEAELDAIAKRQMDEMIEREQKLQTPTGELPVQKMSLAELEADDDTDEHEAATADAFVQAQLEKTESHSKRTTRAA